MQTKLKSDQLVLYYLSLIIQIGNIYNYFN